MSDIKVIVTPFNPALKCARCWKCDYDVGLDKEFPEVCGSCAKTLRILGWTYAMVCDPTITRERFNKEIRK